MHRLMRHVSSVSKGKNCNTQGLTTGGQLKVLVCCSATQQAYNQC